MFRSLSVTLTVAILACLLPAQETPKAELFGGYSLVHGYSHNMNGWDGAATANVKSWFGITADVSGHYTSYTVPIFVFTVPDPTTFTGRVSNHFYSFTVGPQFSYRRPRYTPFVHGLLGFTHLSSTFYDPTQTPSTTSGYENGFTTLLGGGIDIPLGQRISIRPAQAEYVFFHSNGFNSNQFRYGAGLVFRFGQK